MRAMPGGRFSPHVYERLKPRDLLRVEGRSAPSGLPSEAPVVLLASGTGFAPIAAMLRSRADALARRGAVLYWGGRRLEDLYARGEAEHWAQRHPGCRFVPVLSDPAPGWHGRTGFVHEAVVADIPDTAGHEVYACGNPLMVDAARTVYCRDHGLPPARFHSDAFVTRCEPREAAQAAARADFPHSRRTGAGRSGAVGDGTRGRGRRARPAEGAARRPRVSAGHARRRVRRRHGHRRHRHRHGRHGHHHRRVHHRRATTARSAAMSTTAGPPPHRGRPHRAALRLASRLGRPVHRARRRAHHASRRGRAGGRPPHGRPAASRQQAGVAGRQAGRAHVGRRARSRSAAAGRSRRAAGSVTSGRGRRTRAAAVVVAPVGPSGRDRIGRPIMAP